MDITITAKGPLRPLSGLRGQLPGLHDLFMGGPEHDILDKGGQRHAPPHPVPVPTGGRGYPLPADGRPFPRRPGEGRGCPEAPQAQGGGERFSFIRETLARRGKEARRDYGNKAPHTYFCNFVQAPQTACL